jgi:aspartyl-tRNA(Asn)/glutamyl-tRNA(Gln) amidotransferase subunit A
MSLAQTPRPGSVHEAADALASGATTSHALCLHFLERHDAVDDDIGAFVSLDRDAIFAAADAADSRRHAGHATRFEGIPIVVKDNIAVTGQPLSCASKILAPVTSTYDAHVVQELKAAGFIPFGRANMDEFAMGSSTENSAMRLTRNPHNTDHVPGGSSGGSAAAVASGQALVALGSDTGGSIRQPASFCGVVGMKPTYGRVSRFGLVAFASSLDQIGPVTHDVRDAGLILDVIGGHDKRDCTSLDTPCRGFEAAAQNADFADLRVGVPREFFDVEGLEPEIRAATERAIDVYRDAGCKIVDVSLPNLRYAVATYYVIATAEASSNLARFDGIRYGDRYQDTDDLMEAYFESRARGFGREVKRRIMLGTYVLSSGYYDAYYLRAQKVRTLIRQDYLNALEKCDVLISPVSPTTAFGIGAMSDPLQMYLSDIYTIPINLAGNCAISVPVGADSAGLPIGAQLIAAPLQEATLLRAARALEAAS